MAASEALGQMKQQLVAAGALVAELRAQLEAASDAERRRAEAAATG